ncbi:MAG: AAA family ATPase [Acidobacteria bacterium]|nr:AAA family ATPase [Acidobacteriota bacterium]
MLTRLKVRNFKRLEDADVELGKSVVLIGPNNSGKTTALQAIALWDMGLRQWSAKRRGKASPKTRPGVTINRRDLISIPVPQTNLLWRDVHVRDVQQEGGKAKRTQNVRIDVVIDGISNGKPWSCGLEFDYSNEESLLCRPLREPGCESEPVKEARFTTIPEEASRTRIAYLPPMSGLASVEPKWEPGRVNVLLGEGQTAQVLRNLCYQIYQPSGSNPEWTELCDKIHELFGAELRPPEFIPERGEITMEYTEHGVTLDLSASGRGLQQTLLLLAHLYANPNTVLLLDEPDAHLEILRQRQIYHLLTDIAERKNSQIIAASHSEVVLSEAAGTGIVIAFVGTPHRMNNRDSQVRKSLAEIGWDQYYQAEQTGWVLYLEGSSDLAILRAFAETLGHPAAAVLARPFVHYVSNLPQKAREHFFGLREAKPDLVGVALFDRLDKELETTTLREIMWQQREIENYFCTEEVLLAFATHAQADDLFGQAEAQRRYQVMGKAIRDVSAARETLGGPQPWSSDIKATDDFLDPVFRKFFSELGLPLTFRKSDYHALAKLLPKESIDPEVIEKLDVIADVAAKSAHGNDGG